MITTRVGTRSARRVITAVGTASDPRGASGGPDCQALFAGSSGTFASLYLPTTPGQVRSLPGSGLVEPRFMLRCQDSSGNAGISCAVTGLKLAAAGAVTYGNTVAGWDLAGADKWVGTPEGVNNTGFYVPKATPLIGISPSTQSLLVYAAVCVTSLSAERILWIISGNTSTSTWVSMTAAGLIKMNRNAVNATGALVRKNATPTPFGMEILFDVTNGICRVSTKTKGGTLETVPVAYSQQVNGGWGINVDVGAQTPNALWTGIEGYLGPDAEALGARGAGQLLLDHGW